MEENIIARTREARLAMDIAADAVLLDIAAHGDSVEQVRSERRRALAAEYRARRDSYHDALSVLAGGGW